MLLQISFLDKQLYKHCLYKNSIRQFLYERRAGPFSGIAVFPRSYFYVNTLVFRIFVSTIKRSGLPVKISCLKGEIGYIQIHSFCLVRRDICKSTCLKRRVYYFEIDLSRAFYQLYLTCQA